MRIKLVLNKDGGVVQDFQGALKDGDTLEVPDNTKFLVLTGIQNVRGAVLEKKILWTATKNGRLYNVYADGTWAYKT